MNANPAKELKLGYQPEIISQNIDIAKLRPSKSYDYLIENRNAAFKEVLANPEKLSALLKKRDCPHCGADDAALEVQKDGFDIVKCRRCELIYVNPLFDEAAYLNLYDSKDYNEIVTKLCVESHAYRRDRFGAERAAFIAHHHDSSLPKTYLDVGCASGFTLEAIQQIGWEATGLELTQSNVQFARSRGLNVLNLPLQELHADQQFSALSLFDVLEHLSNPKEILHKARAHMHEGGNLFVYVPNWNSATRYLMGAEGSHFIWPTHHLTYFTPQTLQNMLESCGFEVFHWETQGLDLVDYTWYLEQVKQKSSPWLESHLEMMQFFINASGHGKNLRMFAKKKGKS